MAGETVFLLGTAVLALLLVRALAAIVGNSLRILAVAVTGFGLLFNQIIWVNLDGEPMHPIQAFAGMVLDESGVPFPVPEIAPPIGVTWTEVLNMMVTWEVFATHFLAGVLIIILTMGLMQSSWLLGLLGGLFGLTFVLWTDLWFVVDVGPIPGDLFGALAYVAGFAGILGVILALLVAEPVYQAETGTDAVEPDDVLEELDI
jgi:hypothetical protein